MSQYKAHVVNLSYCVQDDCSYGPERHLAITSKFVALERGNATAISYTWGEITRKRRKIGHFTDGSIATLTLGDDWRDKEDVKTNVPNFKELNLYHEQPSTREHSGCFSDLLDTLQDICSKQGNESASGREPGYIWMDQLSIVQEADREITAALARIPDIYRSFDVVVLFPGSVCECVTIRVHSSKAELEYGCFNALSYGSWFRRLWPRQEFYYARRIQARWTSTATQVCPIRLVRSNTCTSFGRFFDDLNPAARLRCMLALIRVEMTLNGRKFDPEDYITWTLWMAKMAVGCQESAWASLRGWHDWSDGTKNGVKEKFEFAEYEFEIAKFLNGEPLTSQNPSQLEAPEGIRLAFFLEMIYSLQQEARSTTQKRDFVLAVWPDCPRYVPPEGCRQMDLASLLEDATQQLERNFGVSYLNMLPCGMFATVHQLSPLLWRPSHSMSWSLDMGAVFQNEDRVSYPHISGVVEPVDLTTTADIYGSLVWKRFYDLWNPRYAPGAIVALPSCKAIRKPGSSSMPRPQVQNLYDASSLQSTKAIFEFLLDLTPTLSRSTWSCVFDLSARVFQWRRLPEEDREVCREFLKIWYGMGDKRELDPSDHVKSEDTSGRTSTFRGDYPTALSNAGLEVGHYLALRVVCAILKVNFWLALGENLNVMVDLGTQELSLPRLGLLKGTETGPGPTFTVVPSSNFAESFEDRDFGVLSSEVSWNEEVQGLQPGTAITGYQLIGVWVPQVEIHSERVDFVVPVMEREDIFKRCFT